MVFNNVYEMITPPHVIKKSWFVDYFDGDALRSWWTLAWLFGTGTAGMDDAVDGGYLITTATGGSRSGLITFNDIGHYDKDGSHLIAIIRGNSTSSTSVNVQLFQDTGAFSRQTYTIGANTNSDSSNFLIGNANASAETFVSLGVALDTNFHRFDLATDNTTTLGFEGGILRATNTSTQPTTEPMQPMFFVQELGSGAKSGNIRYLEAYNT